MYHLAKMTQSLHYISVVDPDQLANSFQDGTSQKPPESFFWGIPPSSSWMLEKMACDGQREG